MTRIDGLLQKVGTYRPGDDWIVAPSLRIQASQHQAQRDFPASPSLPMPWKLRTCSDMKLDLVCLAAGMLHDVVEDTSAPIERVREGFGRTCRIVRG